MSEQVPGKFPPRVRVWNTSVCGELNVAAMSGDWSGLEVAVPEDYISLQEHEAIVEKRVAEAVDRIAKMAPLHLATGSADGYGLGLYNGMILAISFVTNKDAKLLNMGEYLAARAQAAQKGEA